MTDGKFYILPYGLRNQYQRWIKRVHYQYYTGIAVMLLLIGGTGANSILNTTNAQSATLEEPYFVETGRITTQKKLVLT